MKALEIHSMATHANAPSLTSPISMGHIYGIDLLRFLASVAVVLFHFKYFGVSAPEHQATGQDVAFVFLPAWASSGWIGVQIFFVLSGYVIAQSAIGASWNGFILKRAVRILPALWICATIALFIRIASGEPILERLLDWLRTMVLSPKGPYIDGVVWTLVVEAIFYALICVSMIVKQRQGGKEFEWLDRVAFLLGSVSGLFLIFYSVVAGMGLEWAASLDWFGYKILLLHHGVYFALGITLFSVTHIKPTAPKIASIVLLILLCLLEIRLKGNTASETANATAIWLFMLAWLVLSITLRPSITRAEIRGAFTTLGKLSYPIYLGHFVLGMYLVPPLAVIIENRILLFVACMLLITTLALFIALGPEPWGQQKLRILSQRILSKQKSKLPSVELYFNSSSHQKHMATQMNSGENK